MAEGRIRSLTFPAPSDVPVRLRNDRDKDKLIGMILLGILTFAGFMILIGVTVASQKSVNSADETRYRCKDYCEFKMPCSIYLLETETYFVGDEHRRCILAAKHCDCSKSKEIWKVLSGIAFIFLLLSCAYIKFKLSKAKATTDEECEWSDVTTRATAPSPSAPFSLGINRNYSSTASAIQSAACVVPIHMGLDIATASGVNQNHTPTSWPGLPALLGYSNSSAGNNRDDDTLPEYEHPPAYNEIKRVGKYERY